MARRLIHFLILIVLQLAALAVHDAALAQNMRGMPSIPTSGLGIRGSVGVGFADFTTVSPSADFKIERGTFLATQIERGFDVLHLYLTLGLNFMDASGVSNYSFTNLSSSTSYALSDVNFRAQFYELTLGLKAKLIDNYWFRPYIEGGGIGRYNEISYGSKLGSLASTGSDYKGKDVIMGSGYYVEAGIEAQFAEKFGVKLAARRSNAETKPLDTLNKRILTLMNETYYLAVMFGM